MVGQFDLNNVDQVDQFTSELGYLTGAMAVLWGIANDPGVDAEIRIDAATRLAHAANTYIAEEMISVRLEEERCPTVRCPNKEAS